MALLLLYERKAGQGSKIHNYVFDLCSIPVEMPVIWSDDDIDSLQYPALASAIRKQQADWQKQFDELQQANPAFGVQRGEFFWAMQVVRSRAFSGPYTGMLPCLSQSKCAFFCSWCTQNAKLLTGPRLRQRAQLAFLLVGIGAILYNFGHLPIEQVAFLEKSFWTSILPAKPEKLL